MAGRSLLFALVFALFASTAFAFPFGLSTVQTSPIGVGCYDVKTADLNGDGIPDVVVASIDAVRITVLLATPAGLAAPTHYPSGHATAVDLADYDGNGSIDILEADWNENRVSLWLNQGDGTFVLNGSTTVTTNPRDVASGDFDGDGSRDAAVATADGKVEFLKGQPGGGFTLTGSLTPGGVIKGIAAGDLDNDGDVDLAAIDAAGRRLFRLRNDGAMTFVLQSTRTFAGSPSDIALGQLDGDAFLDAAVSLESGFVAVVGGGPDFGATIGTFQIGSSSQSVAIADFDAEGGPDLLVSNYDANTVQVLRNQGSLQFSASVIAPTGAEHPRSAAAGDFNSDGRTDIVAGNFVGGTVTVLRNGPANPHLLVGPAALDFGQGGQGVVTVKMVQLQNTGTSPLTVTPGAIDGAEFAYSGSSAPIELQAGGFASISVQYLRSVLGPANGTLHFSSDDPAAPDVAIPLSGSTVVADPGIAFTPASLDFGSSALGDAKVLLIMFTNPGNAPVTVTPGAIDGSEFDYSGSSAPFTIQPGAAFVEIGILYKRSVLGDATGILHLTTTDADLPALEIALSGNAAPVNPEIAFTPPALDFGSSYLGNAKVLAISFTNPGNAPVTVTPGAIDGDEFVYSGSSAPFTVRVGATKTLSIQYKRSVVGDATGTVHLTTTDVDHPDLAIPLTGNTAPLLTKVSYTPQALDFGSGYLTFTTVRTVTFTNVGNQPLTVTPGAIDGSEFAYSNSGPPLTIQPGFSGTVNVVFKRTVVGTATGTLHVATNDPDQAAIAIALTGTTLPSFPKITASPASLDFGSAFDGIQQAKSFTIKNEGNAVLTVTPGAIDGDQFVYDSSSSPFSLGIGASRSMPIRYLRSATGPASGTLHLGTNDPDAPDFQVALSGVAVPPPVASFSSPLPVTVSVGASAPATVMVRNTGASPLQLTVPASVGDQTEVNPFDVGPSQQDFWRMSSSNALWNIDWEGRVVTGANGEYHWGMDESNFLVQTGGMLGLGGRELRLGPVAIAGGIVVTRKIYIPETGDWARFIDVAENPGEVPRTATFDLFDNIGYTQEGPLRTSDGDEQFELSDDWLVIPVTDRRSVARVFRSVGAANVPVVATWFQTTVPGCYSRTKYVATLPPHSRTCVIQWAVQGVDADAAQALVEALRQDPGPGLVHADAIDRGSPWNLVPDPRPFRLTAGPATIAPGDSLEVPVTFGAEAATHDADLTSVLRIATNDPQHPVLAVPLAFSIANGQVIGVDPGPSAAPAVLELSGFRPNPTRLSGSARVSFRLATSEPATLTLYDVRGRQLARQVIESPQPGPRSIALTGALLRPGVVWMRLEQGGRVAKQKGIVLP